jgi:hypothetical protein
MGVLMEPDVHDVSGRVSVPVPVPDATKRVGTRPHPVTGTPLPVPITHVVFWSPQVGHPAGGANLSKATIGDSEFAWPLDSVSNTVRTWREHLQNYLTLYLTVNS